MTSPIKKVNAQFSPQHMFVILCKRCNLSCVYCAQSSHPGATGQLDVSVLSAWLRNAEMGALTSVDFSGGEPLLADGFSELLEDVLERTSLEVTIASNLYSVKCLDESLLKENAHRLHWRIALEGVSAESHDAIRGKGSFAALLSGLDYLRKNEIVSLSCITVIRPGLLRFLPSMVELLGSHGFKRHNWVGLLPFGRGSNHRHWGLEPSLWFDHLRPLARDLSLAYDIEIALYGPILRPEEASSVSTDLLDDNRFLALTVFPDGSVYCNCFIQAFITRRPIDRIYRADFAELRSRANQEFQNRTCERCRFQFACFGIKPL